MENFDGKIAFLKDQLSNASEEKKNQFPLLYAITEQLLMELGDKDVSKQTLKDLEENIRKILESN